MARRQEEEEENEGGRGGDKKTAQWIRVAMKVTIVTLVKIIVLTE